MLALLMPDEVNKSFTLLTVPDTPGHHRAGFAEPADHRSTSAVSVITDPVRRAGRAVAFRFHGSDVGYGFGRTRSATFEGRRTEPMNIIVGVITIVIGIGFVVAGRGNVSRRLSSDRPRRLASRAAGGTSEHAGGVAAFHGWVGVVAGVALIVFGVVFMVLA